MSRISLDAAGQDTIMAHGYELWLQMSPTPPYGCKLSMPVQDFGNTAELLCVTCMGTLYRCIFTQRICGC